MRFNLPESARRRQRPAVVTLLSAIVHGLAISAMLAATAMSAERGARPAPVTEQLVYVKPQEERSAPRAPAQPAAPPPVAAPVAPLERFVTVEASLAIPVDVPTTLPDVSAGLFSPTPPSADGRHGVATGGLPAGATGQDGSAPWSAFQVEREVVALRGVTPRYPESLSRAGIEGTVVARFVVDTSGRVERGSIEIARADHPLFDQSVREALNRMRFAPAEAGGRRVRQLVEQPFSFALRVR
jgi:periplasmic protein TonB